MLKQKSREKWISEGDSNTKFFHANAQRRNARNAISGIWCDEGRIVDPLLIKKQFAYHFELRFKARNFRGCFGLGSLLLQKISEEEASMLEYPFDHNEIVLALEEMGPDKAPGPDGFNARYIKFLWKHLEKDILKLFNDFHSSSILPDGVNKLFLALIPKVLNPVLVSDFRPISLINCSLKILLKVLANR